MKLKDGKRYETADGRVFKVRQESDGFCVWAASGNASVEWDYNGESWGRVPDLIRLHYKKPQPAHKLDLKQGDVVGLCGWEDGCICGVGDWFTVDKNGPYSYEWDLNKPKGTRPLFKVVSRA